ncbi:protein of unknown function [Taphrina deformans PYCC 5710]|uniref:ABC transporter domain-containing protein n=1 Tax=Taphrina deformans (strain PYCC 5710 / ATCC 11124 / CBS 356.35 / IMI 108563 / JCM 9778 / NBRC 8474) TaxID=1097556 RepID=R4XGC4_TAPDE|nr:protein of unknown function [Taphrina deformans PYCC 5710]|eukprot:CCG84810.1 protein of unknown function [Taphrina deformans PYCC 5710]
MQNFFAPALSTGAGDVVLRTFTNDNHHTEDNDYEKDKVQNDWKMLSEVTSYSEKQQLSGMSGRRLGVTWENLNIEGVGNDLAIQENFMSQFNIPKKISESRRKAPTRKIVQNSFGCVRSGEMLLVLGRPGAGCTSLLKVLSNRRSDFHHVSGEVHYGSMTAKEAETYRGQIVMNTEEELFYPTLTVGQTIDFATKMKVPYKRPESGSEEEWQTENRSFLLRSMGIEHTHDTKVGNEYVRGVSGGERKRVSIIETLASRASVMSWDNSTRGLDASTALQYTKAIRAMTDILGLSSIVTLYQAGNAIFDLFDKVLILDEGKQLFYGPRAAARPFMENLGFFCDDAANVGDYLTGVVVPTERRIIPGYENKFPRTADAIQAAYDVSEIKSKVISELTYPQSRGAQIYVEEFKSAIGSDKHKSLPKKSPLTVSFMAQVRWCVARQYQILWGDKTSLIIKQVSTLVQALIAGSLFYNAPNNSAGLFIKSGSIFFALLYNALLAISEVTDSFAGRPVLAKHKNFAFFHPAAFCLAQIAADIPVLLFQVSHFTIVLYFMTGLEASAAKFFTFWIIIFAAAMCMTAFFRAVGAAFPTFDDASKFSGFMLGAYIVYTGYLIPKTSMHPWFVWIYWIDPLAYGFSALLSNEFHGKTIDCVGPYLAPNYAANYANPAYQSCMGVLGAVRGATTVQGDAYLAALSYSHSTLWRNFGVIWCWWLLFVIITIFFTNRWSSAGGLGYLLVPREKINGRPILPSDEEAALVDSGARANSRGTDEVSQDKGNALVRNTSVFTWKNLTYTVKTPSGDRILLDNVQGWVKPGMLGALMGASGAGKTTLLDVLAQRKTDGTIRGAIMVDGRALPVSFQRSAGYCEQLDIHEPYATVREALEFSALLRQSRETPREEKLRYVGTIIDLLELHDIEHALIGRIGAGLSVEQRKRLTIGVELVSKPSILIFLDEPTSGLDGQAAFNTVRFLKKLAAAGQAILVTIHQPSAALFNQFDTLLLLQRGGKTVYFGDIGDNSKTLTDYFAKYGEPCPSGANPAEHMIDIISGEHSSGKSWNEVWLESDEHSRMNKELDNIISTAASREPGTKDDGHEFALSLWDQCRLVTQRMNISLYRNTDYVNNKIALHVGSALFNGFTFWMIGNSAADLQLRLFTIFLFIFVAPGVINQLQPLFLERRDIYEAREKKSKMYSWIAFVTGLIISEIPYLLLCGLLYWACWYYTVGFPKDSNKAGAVLFMCLIYEMLYTGIGQFIAAYAPNAVSAALANPLLIGTLVSFCGVLVPYSQINVFWRFWIYYLNPFTYLIGGLMTFTIWDVDVHCKSQELAVVSTPNGQSCIDYLQEYLTISPGVNLLNPDATASCQMCQYTKGSDYLATININNYVDGWRDSAIVVIFCISSYALVYLMMKLRTKASLKAQ